MWTLRKYFGQPGIVPLSYGLFATLLFLKSLSGYCTDATPAVLPEPRSAEALPDDPTSTQVSNCMVFAGPLVADINQAPLPGENAALAAALKQYSTRKEADDLSSITGFLNQYPNSTWKASLLTNLGTVYYRTGYFDRALDTWETAWNTSKASDDPSMKAIADRAVSQFARMSARLGRYDRLSTLFVELKGRKLKGSSAEYLLGAKEAYILMTNHPERSFRCGPLAVGAILAFEHSAKVSSPLLGQCQSSRKGISLATLKKLTDNLGMSFQLAKRSPGAQIILPSVVHWKVDHYGALVRKLGSRIELQDPTFGENLSVTKKALDTEASGYFLVPSGRLPPGWEPVSKNEAASIWGKGALQQDDPTRTSNCDYQSGGDLTGPDSSGPCTSCVAMPRYSIHTMLVSLHIMDTPLPYKPPCGQALDFTVGYSQRGVLPPDDPDSTTYANLGGQWTFNWLSYISDDPTNDGQSEVYLYLRGGGVRPYLITGTSSGLLQFGPQATDHSTLIQTSTSNYELDYSDGSKDIFTVATPVDGPGRMIFMTQSIRPSGNAVVLSYSNYQIMSITGSAGASLNITYNPNSSIAVVSTSNSVISGSGSEVQFNYGSGGQLTGITDAAGMQSSFGYGYGGSVVTSMTTLYGTTTFTYGDNNVTSSPTNDPTLPPLSAIRWLQATDPQGGTERLEFWGDSNPAISDTDPAITIPSNIPAGNNVFLSDRNAFYWSKKAFMDAPGDYTQAKLTHFLHTSDGNCVSGVIESQKMPLENRVWYLYPDQPPSYPYYVGSTESPIAVSRVINNATGATQLYQYQYNAAGNRTKVVDPANRVTTYSYASNNIDLIGVYQENPSATGTDSFGVKADNIAAYSYNTPPHLPVTGTDAAGQATVYAYNAQGQMTSMIKDGGTTTWTYDGNNFLTQIQGPITTATTSFSYDSLDRIHTITDSEGYYITYVYDSLNRPTLVTYPDASTEETIYNRRDVEWKKDRANRWTHYLHDGLGRLTFIVDAAGHTTQYQYCPCGALTGIVDGTGNTTTFMQDVQSRLIEKIFADQSTISYAYEPVTSRLQSVTDAKGQTTTYSYNSDNTLAGVNYSGSATPSVSYTYDPVYNRRSTMSESVTGLTTYNYNPSATTGSAGGGMLASIVNSGSCGYTLSYGYDGLGRVVSRAIDDGTNTETTAYDALNRVTQVVNLTGTYGYTPYNATNRIDHITYPNGQLVQYAYYGSGTPSEWERLETITNYPSASNTTSIISQFGYGYNAAGDITSWAQQSGTNAAATYGYAYDGARELLSGIATSGTATLDTYAYRYDAAGNRLSQQINDTVTTSAYNNLNQLTSVSGTGQLQLMISGSLSEPGTVTVAGSAVATDTYNNFTILAPVVAGSNSFSITAASTGTSNNVTSKTLEVSATGGTAIPSIQYDLNGSGTNDGTRTYTWDAANRLIAINEPGGLRSQFAYDGMGRRVQIIESSSGTVTSTKNLIWDGMRIREERNASNAVTKFYFDNGVQISGSNYYYTRDHLGSIREMTTGTNAAVQAEYSYDPYGQQTRLSGTMTADFGFTGLYVHQPSGLNLAPFRAYSSNLGRWISRDPIGERGGINLYDYVSNNPIGRTDPLGLIALSPTFPCSAAASAKCAAFCANRGGVKSCVEWVSSAFEVLGVWVEIFDYTCSCNNPPTPLPAPETCPPKGHVPPPRMPPPPYTGGPPSIPPSGNN